MNIEEIKIQYNAKIKQYSCLEQEVVFTLEEELSDTGIKFHSIPSRIKDLESFVHKAKRKEFKKPFKDIQDIVGVRVICLFRSDIEKIGKLIRKSFKIISEDNKVEDSDITSFGYSSVHFICEINPRCRGARYKNIKKVPFEIQVRTLAMDAWANISHYLDYKNEVDIPKDLKRDFYALSGLLFVADSHFEMLYKERQKLLKATNKLSKKDLISENQEINLDTLTAYLKKKFTDRRQSSSRYNSILVKELKNHNYNNIKEIDTIIDKMHKKFIEREQARPPSSSRNEEDFDGRFNAIGAIRISMKLYDPNYEMFIFPDE